jgi:hypothetical protein
MVNLSQLSHSVKPISAALVPNPNHPLSQGHAYRQLKEAGWACYDPNSRDKMESHPIERVPVFRLGAASIRRNRTGQSHWLIEIGGETFAESFSVAEITAAVHDRLADLAAEADPLPPPPPSSFRQIADWLKVEYPALADRIDRALELVETGRLDLDKYGTEWDNAGYFGTWRCDCPDALHRGEGLQTNWGSGCKHALGGLIIQLAEGERKTTAYRRLADKIERDRERVRATQSAYDQALRPDAGNIHGRARYQFGRHIVR